MSSPPRPTRRSFLVGMTAGLGLLAGGGVVGGALVERDVLPGRTPLARWLGQAGRPGVIPTGAAAELGPIRRGSFVSAARAGRTLGWMTAYPPGSDPDASTSAGRLPVALVLHGRGDDATHLLTVGYPAALAVAVRAGLPPFALAAVDGGDRYWHRRADGDDPARMITDEWLPRLADVGLAARPQDRIGLIGWSMGGYGALLLAARLGPSRVAAVVAESPALWRKPQSAAPGAFDNAADFHANDIFDHLDVLRSIPVRIDCGIADPFHTTAKHLAADLPGAVTDLGAGDHSLGYWRRFAPEAVRFVADHSPGQR